MNYFFQAFVEFFIFNNGQPINIEIGHGASQDGGDKEGNGTCHLVVFDGSSPDKPTQIR